MLFVHIFLVENSCLNCLKVDKIKDNEEKKKYIYFLDKNTQTGRTAKKKAISPAV